MMAFAMKKWLWLLCLSVFLLGGCGAAQKAGQAPSGPVELNVSAALGLKDVLLEVQKNYEAKHPEVKITFNLAAAGVLQKQIEQGAPVDVFISASPKQVDELTKKGLVNTSTRTDLAGNQLVLIVDKDSPLALSSFQDLVKPVVKTFGMGSPDTVPAGEYARQTLEKLGIWDKVKDKAAQAKDVQTVVAYVATGNVEAGIVFSTVAATNKKVKVAAVAPAGTHEPIVFTGAVLAKAKQAKTAADFMTYLKGPESGAIFKKYGFVPL